MIGDILFWAACTSVYGYLGAIAVCSYIGNKRGQRRMTFYTKMG